MIVRLRELLCENKGNIRWDEFWDEALSVWFTLSMCIVYLA